MFDIPLTQEPAYSRFYENNPRPASYPDRARLCAFDPESYIWKSFLQKKRHVAFDHMYDSRSFINAESDLIFANNLVICSPAQLGFCSLKYRWRINILFVSYVHSDWLRLYSAVAPASVRYSVIAGLEKTQIILCYYACNWLPRVAQLIPFIDDSVTPASFASCLFYFVLAFIVRLVVRIPALVGIGSRINLGDTR